MKARLAAATLLALAAAPASSAWSDDLNAAIARCDANPQCSHDYRDRSGRMVFRIKDGDQVVVVQCGGDGGCAKILPRGRRIELSDAAALLSAQ